MRLCVRRFTETVGSIAVTNVTAQHIIKFRDALERRPRSSIILVTKHLAGLHRLFNVAVSEGLVKSNPTQGIHARRIAGSKPRKPRLPFTSADVRAIFGALSSESIAFRWVVTLLAYHGARSTEIVQLRKEDVLEKYGFRVLNILDDHESKSVKTPFSRREVPLHPACSGFVDYVAGVGGPWVFDFPVWEGRARGAAFQRLFTDYLRKRVKISDPQKTLHSLRHTFRDLCRELDMPGAVSRALMGHSLGDDDHAGYGSVPSLKKRAEWIAKIDPLD